MATDPAIQMGIPPMCTRRGIVQSLALSFQIETERKRLGIEPANVRFCCSYLPRAMQTAMLAAMLYRHHIHASARPARIDIVCYVGERPNSSEVQEARAARALGKRAECVSNATESTSTRFDTQCWAQFLNTSWTSSAIIKMPSRRCSGGGARCPKGLRRAWEFSEDHYDKFVKKYVGKWLASAEKAQGGGSPKLYVVVSHGAYITSNLLPSWPRDRKMPNTGIVCVQYRSTGIHEIAPRFTEAETKNIAVPPSVMSEVIMPLYREVLRRWGETPCGLRANPCQASSWDALEEETTPPRGGDVLREFKRVAP